VQDGWRTLDYTSDLIDGTIDVDAEWLAR